MIKLSKGIKPKVLVDNASQWTTEYLTCLNANLKPYTKLFIIRIFFERYCLYGIFLKKDADKNISIYDNRGTNHKEVPLWTHINP